MIFMDEFAKYKDQFPGIDGEVRLALLLWFLFHTMLSMLNE